MALDLGVRGVTTLSPAPPGFIDGNSQMWISADRLHTVTILVAQFQTAAQAKSSAQQTTSLARTGAEEVARLSTGAGNISKEEALPVSGIRGAAGFVDTGTVDRAQIVFTKGTYVAVVIAPVNKAVDVARAQFAALPA
jgi:hypothetical protein